MRLLLSSLTHAFGDAQQTMVSATVVVISVGESLVVGRDPECQFVISQDPLVSRRHFEIVNDGRRGVIRDAGSSNGTFVNGQQIQQAELGPGDQIAAGKSFFKIGILDSQDESEASTRSSISFIATKSDEGVIEAVREVLPLQVTLEIPRGDGQGLTTETVAQLLPIVEAGESRVFGRTSVGVDMVIRQDSQMSANHFELRNDGQAAWIIDLESTNGLFLNGQRISKARLKHDDLVLAGTTSFRVRLYGGIEPSPEELESSLQRVNVAAAKTVSREKSTPFQSPRITNETGLQLAVVKGRLNFPGYSLTVVLKGTFDLKHGEVASLAEKQQFISGEVRVAGDDGTECLVYDSDIAHYKPRADIVFHGSCYAPNGVATPTCRATLAVGTTRKSIDVYGDRHWESTWMDRATTPIPFVSMPMTFQRAFGGPKFFQNPVGCGIEKRKLPDGQMAVPLPNLLEPGIDLHSSSQQVRPTTFGPVDSEWVSRKALLGTFDERWIQTRSLSYWYPEDLQWEYFNSAQRDLQVDGYLRGDEEIRLTNLHPRHPEFVSRLPGLRAQVFVCGVDNPKLSNASQARFREVKMCLDTAFVDGDNEQLILLWRGVIDVSHTYHPEIKHIFVHTEATSLPREPSGYYWKPFLESFAKLNGEWEMEPEVDEEGEEGSVQAGSSSVEEEAKAAFPGLDKVLSGLNIPTAEDELARLEKEARVALIKQGIDPDNPPPLTAEQEAVRQKILKNAGIQEEDDDDPQSGDTEDSPADEEGLAGQKRAFVEAQLNQGNSLAGADLADADLSKLDLSNADLSAADLSGANLRKANLSGAKMCAANLSDADLSAASMVGTLLTDAILSNANMLQSVFQRSDLSRADFSNSILQQAKVIECTGEKSIWHEANLAQTEFLNCNLKTANFDSAKMSQTTLESCDLSRASFADAIGIRCEFSQSTLDHAVLSKAMLPGSSFRAVTALESVWTEADLSKSSFAHAILNGADMGGAILDECEFNYAKLKHARLAYAALRQAKLVRADLFRVYMEGADLTQANISLSNLYGAELMDAKFDHVRCESTNFKATVFYVAGGS